MGIGDHRLKINPLLIKDYHYLEKNKSYLLKMDDLI